ncbi:unnamed protein product [Ambrosiozyma monospora]|uniref:Unnamed protein product n=1 Tax=Ambrosiozyma monospora TaxID=43982 RepID=A0A9W6Z4G2_AMBMO|nr:unnamed protein product [Ambrosiozyma monospora]
MIPVKFPLVANRLFLLRFFYLNARFANIFSTELIVIFLVFTEWLTFSTFKSFLWFSEKDSKLSSSMAISVVLAFVKQSKLAKQPQLYKTLIKQILIGAIVGVVLCLILGCSFIGAFYSLGNDIWGKSENVSSV